jgi:hypothetical protein
MTFGEKLREARKEAKLSQEEFGSVGNDCILGGLQAVFFWSL